MESVLIVQLSVAVCAVLFGDTFEAFLLLSCVCWHMSVQHKGSTPTVCLKGI